MVKKSWQHLIRLLTILLITPLISSGNLAYAQTATTTGTTTTTVTSTTSNPPDAPDLFPDVKVGNGNYVGIKYLKEHGLIIGYPDGLFRPTQNVNRAEALKILGLGIPYQIFSNIEKPLNSLEATADNTVLRCPFPDLNKTAWYFPYVCGAFQKQVISGYPDGTFKPEQTINKVEALKMSILQSGISTNIDFNDNFNDLVPTDWFWDYGRLANQKNFFVEDRSGNLNPAETLNRGDFSMMIYRILRSIQNNSEFGRATYYAGRFDGQSTATGETFTNTSFTAAHKTLPFNTYVKVTNLANNKSVIVRINDRGPYVNGTIIDLSTSAFTQLAPKSTGVINSEVEVLTSEQLKALDTTATSAPATTTTSTVTPTTTSTSPTVPVDALPPALP